MAAEATKPSLRRDLGLPDAVAVGLGAIVGAGLFVVTGAAARVAGPAFLVGLVLAGAAAACNALSSAQLAARYPQSGGAYEFGCVVLHPWAGFAAGFLFLASKLSAGGAVALGFAGYFAALVPGLPPRVVAVAAVAVLTAVNLLGVRKAGRLNTGIVAVTVLSLLVFVACALPRFDPARLTPFAPAGCRGVLESAALLFFAYTGYARLATLGEEVTDPRRTIPRAIVLSLALAAGLYVVVSLAAVGLIGAGAMANSPSPILAAAEALPSRWVGPVTAVGAASAMLGVLLSQLLGVSRMAFAMARRGDLPPALAHVHPRTGVPDRGVVLAGCAAAALAWWGALQTITAAASFTILLYYGITNLAALRMPRADKLYPDAVAALGLAACLLLAAALPWPVIGVGLAGLAAGFVLRAVFRAVSRR
jgi:APA family basic amino acid/polyamine antiporter